MHSEPVDDPAARGYDHPVPERMPRRALDVPAGTEQLDRNLAEILDDVDDKTAGDGVPTARRIDIYGRDLPEPLDRHLGQRLGDAYRLAARQSMHALDHWPTLGRSVEDLLSQIEKVVRQPGRADRRVPRLQEPEPFRRRLQPVGQHLLSEVHECEERVRLLG